MLPIEKPLVGRVSWMCLLIVKWMLLGSAWSSSSSLSFSPSSPSSSSSSPSSSDIHLLSPTSETSTARTLPRPDQPPQGPHGPRHHQPPVSIYRSPASLRVGHGEWVPPPSSRSLSLVAERDRDRKRVGRQQSTSNSPVGFGGTNKMHNVSLSPLWSFSNWLMLVSEIATQQSGWKPYEIQLQIFCQLWNHDIIPLRWLLHFSYNPTCLAFWAALRQN